MDMNDHHIVSLTLGPVEHSPEQADCPEYWVRRLAWIDSDGHTSQLNLFAEHGPECLALLGEKPAEARLDAYADQARESDPLLSPPREPLLSPPRARESCPPEHEEFDLAAESLDDALAALPAADGTVDLAAEANPPRFQAGDRVTPTRALDAIGAHLYVGMVRTVEDASPDGLSLRLTEGSRTWFPADAFRLADPDPLAEAAPDNAADSLRPKPLY